MKKHTLAKPLEGTVKIMVFVLSSVFLLIFPFPCAGAVSAAGAGSTPPREEVSQLPALDSYPRSPLPPISTPAIPSPPPPQTSPVVPPLQENRGAFNPRTGERYPSSGTGVYNPTTGEYYPASGNGYVNPRTGEYYPRIDHDRP